MHYLWEYNYHVGDIDQRAIVASCVIDASVGSLFAGSLPPLLVDSSSARNGVDSVGSG
jgi:hypothetical protein